MAKQHGAQVRDSGSDAEQLIDPRWIAKSVGVVIVASLVCGYLVLCLMFWQGSWQLVLHPQRTSALLQIPNVKAETARFAADPSGRLQLTGYWIPADGRYAALYLRGGDGALANDANDKNNIALLHDAGFTVLAFDYRGYGQSDTPHPSEKSMHQDAGWAFQYLTEERGYSPDRILVFGEGLGGVLAARLTEEHASLAVLVVHQPDATAAQRIKDDPRGRIVPANWLLRDRFDLQQALQGSTVPKLLVQTEAAHIRSANEDAVSRAFEAAASPKTTIYLSSGSSVQSLKDALKRFLDERLPAATNLSTISPNRDPGF